MTVSVFLEYHYQRLCLTRAINIPFQSINIWAYHEHLSDSIFTQILYALCTLSCLLRSKHVLRLITLYDSD